MQLALCGMLNPVKSYKVSMDIMLMLCQLIWHQDLIQIHLSQGFVLHLITLPVSDYFHLFDVTPDKSDKTILIFFFILNFRHAIKWHLSGICEQEIMSNILKDTIPISMP